MFEIVITIFGIAASMIYMGYLAFAIKATPLWVIAIATFALMIRQLIVELRNGADRATKNDKTR